MKIFLKSKVFLNITWLFSDKVLQMFLSLFSGILLARYLGTEKYGELNYVRSFIGMLMGLSTLGMGGILVREFVEKNSTKNEVFSTSLILRLIGGTVLFLFVLFYSYFFEKKDTVVYTFWILGFTTIFQAFTVFEAYYKAHLESKIIAKAKFYMVIFSLLTKIVFVYFEADYIYFVWGISLEIYIYIFVFLKKNSRQLFFESKKINFAYSKLLLKSSYPFLLSGAMIAIYMKIDTIMIHHFLTDKEVGLYSVAVRVMEMFIFLPAIFSDSFFPKILNDKKNYQKYKNLFQVLFNLNVLIMLGLSVFLSIFSEIILTLLFSEQYVMSATVLRINAFSLVFIGLGVSSSKYFISENIENFVIRRSFWGSLINIFLNIIFIPRYGIEGAAISSVISYSVSGFFVHLFYKKSRKLFFMQLKALFGGFIFSFNQLKRLLQKS
jgi:O-antigen/teichoic acid export membrane protein